MMGPYRSQVSLLVQICPFPKICSYCGDNELDSIVAICVQNDLHDAFKRQLTNFPSYFRR